ncbi:unnamed protein product [Darwinula stevensoni]|uniref:Uncharacterized protein n=1 Tax=Darwinula stevensoni TaxID=69355 RepID=A0A7R9A850_9CRUS|nr:unnamed protein product [Darwinula stevensoni]CAG0895423.1 unnamed protein product [Darwinula stevensoni]
MKSTDGYWTGPFIGSLPETAGMDRQRGGKLEREPPVRKANLRGADKQSERERDEMLLRPLGSHWASAAWCVLGGCVLAAASLDHTRFLRHIFDKYGSEGVITYEGFEHLLQNLGLGRVVIEDHEVYDHFKDNGKFLSFHDVNHTHALAVELEDSQRSHEQENFIRLQPPPVEEENILTEIEDLSSSHMSATSASRDLAPEVDVIIIEKKCLSPEEIYESYGLTPDTDVISYVNFLHLCPAIVYELDQSVCREGLHHRHHSEANADAEEDSYDSFKVWMCSLVSVLVISLCGVLGVLVIPIMHRVFYRHLLQFLVAMAIGSLTGDALLHLLPHAFSDGHADTYEEEKRLEFLPRLRMGKGGDKGAGDEMKAVYKSLATLGGMAFFFFTERVVGMVSSYKEAKANQGDGVGKKRRRSEQKDHQHPRPNLSSSIPSLEHYMEHVIVENGGKAGREEGRTSYEEEELRIFPSHNELEPENDGSRVPCCQDHHQRQTLLPRSDPPVRSFEDSLQGDIPVKEFEGGGSAGTPTTSHCDNGSSGKDPSDVESHRHHHHHKLTGRPGSISAVAWMTGMTGKQALFYNLVSSILCFLGMVIGVLLGNIHSFSSWIFALTAGIFLYVALVDMLPELSTDPHTGSRSSVLGRLALQLSGMTLGASIMLVIAVKEHDLMDIFSESS